MRRRKWERERSRGRAGAWLTAWGTLRGGEGEAREEEDGLGGEGGEEGREEDLDYIGLL